MVEMSKKTHPEVLQDQTVLDTTASNEKIYAQVQHLSKLACLGNLSSGIAHEINNPLVAVKGYAQLIEMSEQASPTLRNYAKEIILASMRIQQICEHLHHYVRDMKTPIHEALDLNDAIERSVVLVEQQVNYRRATVNLSLASKTPLIWGVRSEIQRALQQLLLNSRDAFLSLKDDRKRWVSIKTTYEPGSSDVVLEYSDNAGGIAEEIKSRVFEPFVTSKLGGEVGVGLTEVKNIVESLNGRIELESQPGEGTRFIIYFPVHHETKLKPEPQSSVTSLSIVDRRPSVLVVDDERSAGEVIRLYVKDDFDVEIYEDVTLAIERLKNREFHLIVTDLNMPNRSGLALITHAKELNQDRPVIVMSAYGQGDKEVEEALEAGADAFLQKPFEGPEELRELLRSWVGSYQAMKGIKAK